MPCSPLGAEDRPEMADESSLLTMDAYLEGARWEAAHTAAPPGADDLVGLAELEAAFAAEEATPPPVFASRHQAPELLLDAVDVFEGCQVPTLAVAYHRRAVRAPMRDVALFVGEPEVFSIAQDHELVVVAGRAVLVGTLRETTTRTLGEDGLGEPSGPVFAVPDVLASPASQVVVTARGDRAWLSIAGRVFEVPPALACTVVARM